MQLSSEARCVCCGKSWPMRMSGMVAAQTADGEWKCNVCWDAERELDEYDKVNCSE